MKLIKLKNEETGDILEVPPPDEIGQGVILLNGKVVERVLYSDDDGGSVTLESGKQFRAKGEFFKYLCEKLARML